MSQIALVRLFIRICDAFEFWLVPQSVRFASALYQGVRSIPENFRFRPISHWPLLVRIRVLRSQLGSWIRRAAARLPGWSLRFLRWLRFALVDALVIGSGVSLLVLLWLRVFDFC